MERIRFIDHEGHKILLVDLTGCSANQVADLADEVPEHVTAQPAGAVLLLADFTDSKFTREAVERLKVAAAKDRLHIKRSAWVFNGNLPKPLHDAVQTFSSRDIPRFESRDAALSYLVTGK
jgi:hypothetical protein